MKIAKYTPITTQKQYERYCKTLVTLVFGEEAKEFKNEIQLLSSFIDKWEQDHAFESTPTA